MSEIERLLVEIKLPNKVTDDDYEKRINDLDRIIDSINKTIRLLENYIERLENIRDDIDAYLENL